MALDDRIFDSVLWHIAQYLKDHPDLDVISRTIFEMAVLWPVPSRLENNEESLLFLHALKEAGPIVTPPQDIRDRMVEEMADGRADHLICAEAGTYHGQRRDAEDIHITWYPPNLHVSFKNKEDAE